jgi:diaminopimelate epimerase
MGQARLDWRDVPLSQAATRCNPLALGPYSDPVGCSMGNPHATFFIDDPAMLDDGPIREFGPQLETHALFPEGQYRLCAADRHRPAAPAHGSAVPAGLWPAAGRVRGDVAAARLGLTARMAEIVMDGGTLTMEWLRDGHVLMTGGVAQSFTGTLDPALLA